MKKPISFTLIVMGLVILGMFGFRSSSRYEVNELRTCERFDDSLLIEHMVDEKLERTVISPYAVYISNAIEPLEWDKIQTITFRLLPGLNKMDPSYFLFWFDDGRPVAISQDCADDLVAMTPSHVHIRSF